MNNYIMGLDVSSTTVGISIVDKGTLKLIHVEYFKSPKKCSIFEQLKKTKEHVLKVFDKYEPKEVAIEDIIEYIGRASSSKTTIKLGIFNRTVGLAIYERGITPVLLNVNTIRKWIKPEGFSGKLSKEEVPEALEKIIGQKFPYIYNKKGKIKTESYDMSDAVAVAVAHIRK